MEKLEHKYAVNQTVYFKTTVWVHDFGSCLDCGGTGVLVRKDGIEITCPTCKGSKVYAQKGKKGKKIQKVKTSTVEHIEIYVEEDDYNITYYLHSGIELPEVDVFSTEDEAKSACSNDAGTTAMFGLSEDLNPMFTNIPKEDWGVHIYHCCKKHGCKYGDYDNCPVSLDLTKQDHPCESCREEESEDLPF